MVRARPTPRLTRFDRLSNRAQTHGADVWPLDLTLPMGWNGYLGRTTLKVAVEPPSITLAQETRQSVEPLTIEYVVTTLRPAKSGFSGERDTSVSTLDPQEPPPPVTHEELDNGQCAAVAGRIEEALVVLEALRQNSIVGLSYS